MIYVILISRFVIDGTAEDVSRRLSGNITQYGNRANIQSASGVFAGTGFSSYAAADPYMVDTVIRGYSMDTSRQVKIGPEFSTRTFGILVWRRFA